MARWGCGVRAARRYRGHSGDHDCGPGRCRDAGYSHAEKGPAPLMSKRQGHSPPRATKRIEQRRARYLIASPGPRDPLDLGRDRHPPRRVGNRRRP
jgi:hypothetical protein